MANEAFNALTAATAFRNQQEDRGNVLGQQRRQQGLQNTQNKIALAMGPGGGGRKQAQQLATGSGNAQIIGQFQEQLSGLDQAQRTQAKERADGMSRLALGLGNATYEQRVQFLNDPSNRPLLAGLGLGDEALRSFDPTDLNIQTQIRMIEEVQTALSKGFEGQTLNEGQEFVQRGAPTLSNTGTREAQRLAAQGANTARITAEAQRTTAGARQLGAQTGAQAEARNLQELESKLVSGEPVKQSDIRALRGEFEKEFARPFEDAQDQFLAMRDAASDGTGASDVALVFSFFKTIDPASTVREGEFATAASAMGLPAQIIQAAQRADDGQIISQQLREDLIAAAENAIRQRETTVRGAMERYTGLATRARIDPQDVVRDPFRLDIAQPQQPAQQEAPLNTEELQELQAREEADRQSGGQ
ncbi:MAG: hypothetical protein JKY81_01815 [Colwellia sp.]|nr:hypothetical protein [Colwellia sp.]